MDLYVTLGISRQASMEEIKLAYRKMSLIHHPDKGGTEESFKNINEAYQILSNETKRKRYDQTGATKEFLIEDSARDSFITLFQSCMESGNTNILATMKQHLGNAIQDTQKNIRHYANNGRRYKQQARKFTKQKGNLEVDLIAIAARAKRMEYIRLWKEQRTLLALFKRVRELIEEYDYDATNTTNTTTISSAFPTHTKVNMDDIMRLFTERKA